MNISNIKLLLFIKKKKKMKSKKEKYKDDDIIFKSNSYLNLEYDNQNEMKITIKLK